MKTFKLSSLVVGIVASLCFGTAHAIPLYYTFEGVASSVYDPGTGDSFYDYTGLQGNDPISYVFLIDDEVPFYYDSNGNKYTYGFERESNTPAGSSYAYEYTRFSYYTELVSGSGLVIDEQGPSGGRFSASFAYKINLTTGSFQQHTYLALGSSASNGGITIYPGFYDYLDMDSYQDFVEFAKHESLPAHENTIRLVDDNGEDLRFHARLTLTSISDLAPSTSVPEPSALLLLTTGLAGLFITKRKS